MSNTPWKLRCRARKWLRSEGLVSNIDGKELVVWRAVVERLMPVERPARSRKKKGVIAGVDMGEIDEWLR